MILHVRITTKCVSIRHDHSICPRPNPHPRLRRSSREAPSPAPIKTHNQLYTNRERRHLWSSRPSIWLLLSSVADLMIASILAVAGIAMTSLPAWLVAGTLAAAMVFAILLDLVKVPVFQRLKIA
jgi:hypothetical protein